MTEGRDGRWLLHCKKSGCEFWAILAAAGVAPGNFTPPDPAVLVQRAAERRKEAVRKAELARRLVRESGRLPGTSSERYLRARGIDCALPPSLLFHPAAWHGPTAQRLPAMIAPIEGADDFAVHRTFLRADGSGKADVEPAKAMLGASAGGAVRLTDGGSRLLVGEGIESTLSLLCGQLEGPVSAWAALSTSGLRGLRLPPRPGRLTIACDGDAPGRAAAHVLAERAHTLGWKVGILDPGDGRDWNDVLQERGTP